MGEVRDRVIREYEEGLGVTIPKLKIKDAAEFRLERELSEEELERLTDRFDEIYNEDVHELMPHVLEVLFPDEYNALTGKKEEGKEEG